jgi:hypothetical protein
MNIETLCENIYEDLNGYISCIESTYMGLSFIYETDHWDDYDKRVRFKIECEGVTESTLKLDVGGSFELLNDHPVLDEYTGDSGSLFFSSKPENPNEIIGLLYSVHESYFCEWRELPKYLNSNVSFNELLNSGNGLLANAPINVLNIYKNAVSAHLKVNIVKSHKNNDGYLLLVVEDTYVVCKKVSVKYC